MRQWIGFLRSLVIYHNPAMMRMWRRFYCDLLTSDDLAFDVGAHIGNRSRAMRSAGARVVAIEPQQPFAGFLRRTLPRDVVLAEAAVGRGERVAAMAVSSRHPTVSSLQTEFVSGAVEAPGFEHVRWDSTQRVRVVTLDSLIAQHGLPRYIKIDVEGYELEVLGGLSQPVEIVSVEFLPGFPQLTYDVIDRLAELGAYRFNPVQGETGGFLWADWRDGAAVKAWLEGLPADATSGDLFARLVPAETP
jgi:FkbM family methyltransferase